MWLSFVIAMLACMLALYVPGFLVGKALRFSSIVSVVFAPIASIGLLAILGVVLQKAAVPATAVTLGVLAVGVGAVAWAASAGAARASRSACKLGFADEAPENDTADAVVPKLLRGDWPLLILYVVGGMAVCVYLFVSSLGTPDNLYCSYDTQTHLNTVRAFLDSGEWSVFKFTNYLAASPEAIPFTSVGAFYPGAWHVVVAFTCDAVGVAPTVGVNAVVAVMCGIVYPASAFALMRALFPQNRLAVVAGVLVTCAFVAFPWGPIHNGPLYPNQAGDILMVAIMGLSVCFIESRLLRNKIVAAVLFGLCSLLALALTHPNTLFALFVFAVPYVAHLVWGTVGASSRFSSGQRRAVQVGAVVGIAVVAVAFWAACVNLPFMQNVVNFDGTDDHDLFNTLVLLASLKLNVYKAQFLLSAVVVVGAVALIRRKRFWLLVPPILMALAFIGALLPDGAFTKYLAGFWYCQGRRIASVMVVFLLPIASQGLASVCAWVAARFAGRGSERRARIAATVTAILFALISFCPNVSLPGSGKVLLDTPFGHTKEVLVTQYSTGEDQVYSAAERAFVRKVEELAGRDALIMNQPNDGSVWAYGADGLNTYFRYMDASKNERAKTIRLGLDRYASDPEVKAAVDYTGAKYFLQLDSGVSYEEGSWLARYNEKRHDAWKGMDAVTPETPGFTVVLEEGDMRLYRIG